MPSTPLTREDAIHRLPAAEQEIRALGVKRLALIGSVLREDRVDSDVDPYSERYASSRPAEGSKLQGMRLALGAGTQHLLSMPTALRIGPYRFLFYSGDRIEPRHVHVERDASRAKFWLDPVRLADSGGFRDIELNRIAALVEEHREELVRAWDEYFNE